jgi:RNA polymerase sigma factor (sigma-70 family)
MDDPRTDEGLMLSYRDGDVQAFERLYARWRGPLYRYLVHQASTAADELFQEVWMRVIAAGQSYEPLARFSTWLFRIAHNRLMDHYRAGARAVVALYDDPQDDPGDDPPAPEQDTPHAMIERRETAGRILDALAELPEPQREAFLLVEDGGLSLEEVGQATGVGRETAKSRLRYALDRLRRSLEDLK